MVVSAYETDDFIWRQHAEPETLDRRERPSGPGLVKPRNLDCPAGLVPIERIGDFRLDDALLEVLDRATGLTAETGGGRLTTSFLLQAMIELGAASDAHPALRLLRRHAVEPDPSAYRGVWAAYCSWFSGSRTIAGRDVAERRSGPGLKRWLGRLLHRSLGRALAHRVADPRRGRVGVLTLAAHRLAHRSASREAGIYPVDCQTHYVLAVLELARDIARDCGDAALDPVHLLVALLAYDPGSSPVQPGAQYLLTLFGDGLPELKTALAILLEQTRGVPDAPGRWGEVLRVDVQAG